MPNNSNRYSSENEFIIKNKNTICFQEDFEMNDVVKYLQECGTFFLATVEGDQPHVRPFGAVCEFEGKLYIQTGKVKGQEIFIIIQCYRPYLVD